MNKKQAHPISQNYQNAILLDKLCKHFPSFQLHELSFHVPAGSIMGLIGENGAGKTTTIKLILNQLKKDSGSIFLFDQDHTVDEKGIKEEIGVVLDQGFFYEGLHALQISKVMGRLFTHWDHRLFLHHLTQLQVPPQQEYKELSKGTQMKLKVACALAHSPKLLILDEPTGGLDPFVRSEILDLFQEFIQDEQHSILMSSHITDDLEKIADYITFIQDGTLLFSETTDDILNQYGIVKCGQNQFATLPPELFSGTQQTSFGVSALTPHRPTMTKQYPDLVIEPANLSDIMIFYHKRKEAR